MTEVPRTRTSEDGTVMILALIVMILLLVLGTTLLTVSDDQTTIAANDEWSEGAFYAAEAAVQEAIDGLSVDMTTAPLAIDETELGSKYSYRTGPRTIDTPVAPQLVGSESKAGYALNESTGYQSASVEFDIYRITGTGTGPRNSEREVEVEVSLGPISR